MAEFLGSQGSYVLFSNGANGAIVDTALNIVVETGDARTIFSAGEWSLSPVEVSQAARDLADAAMSSLDIRVITASGRMYTIPKGVQAEAQRALDWHKEFNRGGTPVGLGMARTLAEGGQIGIERVRHIAKYFPRHEVDKKATGYQPGEDGFPSAGRIAWALWGGDAGWRWASVIVDRENKKAVTADGLGYEPSPAVDFDYDADLDAFHAANELDEGVGPEFIARVRMDGSGIDRLYRVDIDGQVYVWDDLSWDDLGHVNGDIYTYDRALDDPYDMVEKDYVIIDPASAVVISAYMQQNPYDYVSIDQIDSVEAQMVADALAEIDWELIDRAIVSAGAPVADPSATDGQYTPEERAANASKQVRDAGGKFAAAGNRVTVGGDSSRTGEVTQVNQSDGSVVVKMDAGGSVTVPANTTRQINAEAIGTESLGTTAPSATATAPAGQPVDRGQVLDTSGILGEPRVPINQPNARIPGTLPAMTAADLKQVMYNYPAWVKSQRDQFAPQKQMAPVEVQSKGSLDVGAPAKALEKSSGKQIILDAYNHPLIQNWLHGRDKQTGTPNALWYHPVTADASPQGETVVPGATPEPAPSTDAASVSAEPMTPETSDVQPLYFAVVSPDDPRAVLDLVAIVPASATSNLPTAYKRVKGDWQQDEGILGDLNSATPPPVVPLDTDTLNSVLQQIDGLAPIAAGGTLLSHALMVLWNSDIETIIAAGGLDRNRGNAERLRRYWVHGEGAAKIRWGKGGDWKRCVRYLSKYLGVRAKGYCQLRHKEALGFYTSTHRKMLNKAKGRNNSIIEEFSGGTGIAEPVYEVPVPEEYKDVPDIDLKMDVDAMHAEHDDLYDESWQPDEEIAAAMDELSKCSDEDYLVLIAAGGLDRNRGNAEKLRRYWTIGKGGAKIRWNTKGDWTRCVRHLEKYLGPRAKGYCALRHHEMTGMWTGDRAHAALYGRKGRRNNMFSSDVLVSTDEMINLSTSTPETITADAGLDNGARFFIPLVIPENLESGDGRSFEEGSIDIRDLPLPLLWQIKTGDGHMGSVVVGRIDNMERTDQGIGNAQGVFDTGHFGAEAERLVRNGFLRGVSADMDKFEAEEVTAEVDGEDGQTIEKQKLKITHARVMAVTIVPKPAFQECTIRIVDDIPEIEQQEENVIPDGVYVEDVDPTEAAAIVASGMIAGAIPVVPPTLWFADQKLNKATPLTVTDEGQVFGHIAAWHVDHIGMAFGTKPPRSRSKYAYFHTGVVRTEDGTDVPVGQLTLAGGHASLEASALEAARHYDDTASAIADVHAGEDAYGIWVAGSLRPGATPEQVRALRASAPSGDWRPIKGGLELVAVCQVNVPGFPIARARVASGQVMALVAAGANTLARMKSDPVTELAARLELLERKQNESGMEDIRARFNSIKADLNIEPVTADAGYEEIEPAEVAETVDENESHLVEELEALLSNVVSVYFRAHGYHWNVKGQDFSQYHELFGEIYEDVYSSIDPIAENIRKLGSDSPFNLGAFASSDSIGDSTIDTATATGMAYDLYSANEELVEQLKSVFRCANEYDEQGIANFIAERIDMHQKWSWQLKASVTPEQMQILDNETGEPAYEDEDAETEMVGGHEIEPVYASGGEELEQLSASEFSAAQNLSIQVEEMRARIAEFSSVTEFKNFTPEERKALAEKGFALPDGSYPIRNVDDLKNAIHAYGRSPLKGRMEVRKHIIKRAKALDSRDLIPTAWANPTNSPSHYAADSEDTSLGKA
jgi:DNA-binding ferritin-like protein